MAVVVIFGLTVSSFIWSAFGPFLAGAGLVVMGIGPQVFQRALGLPP